MSAVIEEPSLKRCVEDALVKMLRDIDALDPVSVYGGIADVVKVETPFITVNVARDGERIRNSGAYDCTANIILHTTASEDDAAERASTDAELLAYDAGLEELLFGTSTDDLADTITANADGVRVDAVFGPSSDTPEFDDAKRNISYEFSFVAMAVES